MWNDNGKVFIRIGTRVAQPKQVISCDQDSFSLYCYSSYYLWILQYLMMSQFLFFSIFIKCSRSIFRIYRFYTGVELLCLSTQAQTACRERLSRYLGRSDWPLRSLHQGLAEKSSITKKISWEAQWRLMDYWSNRKKVRLPSERSLPNSTHAN